MKQPLHVVVVGAGIVGAAVAEALALDGLRVTVIDQGPPGRGATSAAMGHVVLMSESDPQFALTNYSRALWEQRAPHLPASIERMVCGTLWIAADDEEMAEVERKRDYYHNREIQVRVLSGHQLHEAEPMLRPGLTGALLVPGDSVVSPLSMVEVMLRSVRERGGRVIVGNAVKSLTGNRAQLQDGSQLECDFSVNACGHLAAALCPGLRIRPRKGHLYLADFPAGSVKHQLVELGYLKSTDYGSGATVAFNVQPRPGGQLLIGSSRQYDDESYEIDQAVFTRLRERAIEYMPVIESLSAVRAWTGFRAATPDKLPLIGPSPHDPHLLLATGHEGLGITTSLATGRLIADHLMDRTPAIPGEPYLPVRLSN